MNRILNIRIAWTDEDRTRIQELKSLGELVQYLAENDLVDKVELIVKEQEVINE